ncbi:MAG TPA: phosphoribosylformylglycinamidine cyclo-ligase, partial [Bryobacteraceae bacterium]|nr:phosphoribosylformylglycinamidine cyclo-ligase [Bryobacteraceae bacterium]
QGAVPLFFLDYFAVGKLDAGVASQVVEGVARGCRNNGCALIGGETAEMPGFYQAGEYDLAGFIVGAVERNQMLTGKSIRPGDILLGLPSNGMHTNGYSLARKLLFDVARLPLDHALADELLRVHRSYLKPIRALVKTGVLKGAAHITGGGITENTPRILPPGLAARVDVSSWTIPPFFEKLRAMGNLDLADYRRTFNLGIGMILVVGKRNLEKAQAALRKLGETSYQIGDVVRSARSGVMYVGETGVRG